jgi:hypothetical protein
MKGLRDSKVRGKNIMKGLRDSKVVRLEVLISCKGTRVRGNPRVNSVKIPKSTRVKNPRNLGLAENLRNIG